LQERVQDSVVYGAVVILNWLYIKPSGGFNLGGGKKILRERMDCRVYLMLNRKIR